MCSHSGCFLLLIHPLKLVKALEGYTPEPPFHPIINIPGFTCLREPRVLMTPAARYWWMCISKQDRWALAKLHSTAGPFVTAEASGAGELNFSNHSNALHSMWGTAQACAWCIPTCLARIQTPFQNICPQLCLGLFTLEEYFSWTTRERRVWQIHWAHEIWVQARCIYRRWTLGHFWTRYSDRVGEESRVPSHVLSGDGSALGR